MTGARRGSGSESSSSANQPPPFLTKTYDLVDDVSTDAIVSWSPDGRSFVVWKPPEFSRDLLPRHFKHNNFSSFVRQLNTYGFRKVDPDRWEFANDNFIRGRRDLLKDIHRRKPTQQAGQQQALAPAGQTAIELGHYGGVHDEIESLKRDKNVLMLELVRLRQQQQAADQRMRDMHERLESQEQRQNTIVNFLARVAQNPTVLQQMVSVAQSAGLQRLSSQRGGRKKRRGRSGDDSDESGAVPPEQNHAQIIQYQPVNAVFARTTSQGLADIEAAAALLASSHIDPAAAAAGPSGRLQHLQHQGGGAAEPSVLIHEQPNTSFGGGIPSVGLDGITHPGMSAAEAADFSAAADIAAAAAYDGLVADPAVAAAVAAGLPNMLLYGDPLQQQQVQQQQQPQLDPAAAAAAVPADPGRDYTQTTTITEVPCMATPGAGGSMQRVPSQQRVPMAAGATTVITPGGATTTTMHAASAAAAAAAAAGGVQVLSPLEVKVESPTAAAAAAAAAAGAGMHLGVQQQPKVDSPEGDLDMGMNDILSNLGTMNSTDLMMTDEMNKDDLWDMLFGQQQGSGAMLSGHSFGVNSGDMGAPDVAALGAAEGSPAGAAVSSPTLQ
ncbi:hypothetical protein OEZ85_008488 [Tetradesmus obliquus]|uniref:HSF-type DNA-binding domain-containing protein n=1 Tax=Tetradesmus obliquus TaxID=3088 RepID=A0ABY8TJ00_TETOB|nr:hypothetical protein OEZ85_008488 [Tetradesmus obliquus]